MCEHLGFSDVIGKRVEGDSDSAITEHIYFAIIHLVLTILPYQPFNKDHSNLNKNRYLWKFLIIEEHNFIT